MPFHQCLSVKLRKRFPILIGLVLPHTTDCALTGISEAVNLLGVMDEMKPQDKPVRIN
jgi:hypothetical protein